MNTKLKDLCTLAIISWIAAVPGVEAQVSDAPTATAPSSSAHSAPANEASVSGSAASPGATGDGLEEIVVTAERRSETLQKTAFTIEVLKPQLIENAGITSPLLLTSVLPNFQIGNSGPATSVYVRGVGSYASTAGQSPAVPYYIDGVYVARSQSVPSEFYDIDRVEVLTGPQGTLYGRNATGGAINILTRKPDFDSFYGYADLEIGNYDDHTGALAINVPLNDVLALRASAQIVDKGGYSDEGLGDDMHQSGRLKLLWKPNTDISLLLNTSYGHIGGLGPTSVILNKDVPGWSPWMDITDPRAQAYEVAHGFAPVPGFVRPNTESEARQDLDFYNISAELNWFFDDFTLTVLPAYRYSRMQYATLFNFEYDNGYGLGTQPPMPETSDATSVEVRLSGNTDQLKWVGGFFFYNEDQFQQYNVNAGYPEHVGVDANFGTQSYATFGQATYAILPDFRLIGGLRYTSDQRSISNGISYVLSPTLFLGPPPASGAACGFPAPTATQCPVDQYAGSRTFQNVSWKGGFEADVLENSLLYATASRGFKAGGFNTQSVIGSPGEALSFQPEVLTSYEIGLKNRFFDNNLQVNISGFYWDYKNHQEPRVGFTNAGLINLVYYNAGSSEVIGGDLAIVAKPWSGGTINASFEYAQSKYNNFIYQTPTATFNPTTTSCIGKASSTNPGFTSVNCSGFEALKTPKWSGKLSLTQEYSVGDGKLVAEGGLTFATERWLAIDFTPIERAPAYVTTDVSLTYQAPQDQWQVTAFIRNINNGVVYTQATQSAVSAVTTSNINPPRTYGVRAQVNF